jgi:hypothetical protein
MIAPSCDTPPRSFWKELLIAVAAAAAPAIAQQIGEGIREAMAAKRKPPP